MNLIENLDQLIQKLYLEKNRLFDLKKKFDLKTLGIDINIDTSLKELTKQLQIKHGIKLAHENGLVKWNRKYQEEALNDTYIQVLDNTISNIQLLIPELRLQFDTNDQKEINKILRKKLKKLNKPINSHEGYLFFDSDYRRSKNNLLKNRFDVIWHINEMYSLFPLLKRNENSLILTSVDYPFISFDIDRWCDLELSYHLIPIFKESLGIQNGKSENYKKIDAIFEFYKDKISYDVLKYIDSYIDKITEKQHSNIVALFYTLKKMELIKMTALEFQTLLNDYYNLDMKTIKVSDPNNYEYLKRRKNIEIELNMLFKLDL